MTSAPGWPLVIGLVLVALVPTLVLLPSYLRRKAERKQRNLPGVYQALNELARSVPLRHVAGTSLVAYRKPVA